VSKPVGVGGLESDLFKWEATVKNKEQRWEDIQGRECKE
jgi:hypothetical protein